MKHCSDRQPLRSGIHAVLQTGKLFHAVDPSREESAPQLWSHRPPPPPPPPLTLAAAACAAAATTNAMTRTTPIIFDGKYRPTKINIASWIAEIGATANCYDVQCVRLSRQTVLSVLHLTSARASRELQAAGMPATSIGLWTRRETQCIVWRCMARDDPWPLP